MKRKKQVIACGLIGVIGSSSTPVFSDIINPEKNRSFGVPGSITEQRDIADNRLKLSMSKIGIPHQIWQDIENLSKMWIIMYAKNLPPIEYTQLISTIKLSEITKNKLEQTKEHKILSALAEPALIEIAQRGDYETLIYYLFSQGVMDGHPESLLVEKMEKFLIENHESTFVESDFSSENALSNLMSVLSEVNEVQPMACSVVAVCVAVITVGVATSVAAAINVAAALNVAVQISVAVNVAVTAGGGGCNSSYEKSCKIDWLEPTMITDLNLMEQFSNITENPVIHTKAIADFKRKEARAVLQAAINIGLVEVSDSKRKTLFEALDKVVNKALETY